MYQSINERIEKLIGVVAKSQKEFAEKTGIKKSTLSAIVGDRKMDPSSSALSLIAKKYTNVDLKWLITGEGEMFIHAPVNNFNGLPDSNDLDTIRKERDLLKDKLLIQHERYQILLEKYNRLEEEINKKKQA